jgi:hypothetical protein
MPRTDSGSGNDGSISAQHMEIRQAFLSIDFTVESALDREAHDGYHYVTPITGIVQGLLDDAITEREVIAGGIDGYRLHLATLRDQPLSTFDIFDTYDDLEGFHLALIDQAEDAFREEALPEAYRGDIGLVDILVITDIHLTKYFRRRGLGALMVERFVELFGGGCLFTALNIEPAREYEEMDETLRRDMALHLFEQDPGKARKKLIAYWEGHRFRHVPDSDVMTMPVV